jgi:hypothetical protein
MGQMKRLYEPRSRKLRAANLRAAAVECERRGYPGIAQVNRELADWIDPPPRIKEDRRKGPVRGREASVTPLRPVVKPAITGPLPTHVMDRHASTMQKYPVNRLSETVTRRRPITRDTQEATGRPTSKAVGNK